MAVADTAAVKVGAQVSPSPPLAASGVLGKGPSPAFQMSSSHASLSNRKPLTVRNCADRPLPVAVPTVVARPRGPPPAPGISVVVLFYSADGTSLGAQGL